jgi:ATP-binding cassette, subfamily B, bacterial PglK
MIKSNLNYLDLAVDKRYKNQVILYSIFSFLIALLETIGVGVVPGVLVILLDKNIILEKAKFNDNFYYIVFNFFNSEKVFTYLVIMIFSFFLLKTIINLFFIIFESSLFNKIKINLSSKMFRIYIKKNYLFHSNNNPIILGRNISSEVNISISYLKSFLLILKEITQVLLIGILLLSASFEVSITIFFILLFLSFIYFKFVGKILKKKVRVAYFERGEKSKIINQVLNSIIEIKLYQKTNFFIKKFTESISREFKSIVFYEIFSKVPRQIIELLIITLICFAIYFSSNIGINVKDVISIILLYFFAAMRIYPSINNIVIFRLTLVQNQISIKKICHDIKNESQLSENIDHDYEKYNFEDSIKIKNLSFEYPGREITLSNINFEIKKNEIIGLVGITGSGKSTLVKIIMGLFEPTDGEILIDNNHLKNIKYKWQKNFSYIPQNFYILDDTILENILFGVDKKEVDNKLLQETLKFTSLDKFINELPEKINTTVGPNGKKLSGGQLQRLAIARAMYKNRNILVFDEATNSLDKKTEGEILDKIYRLKGSKTIIIISHNHKILDKCDKIYKIESGKFNQTKII